MSHARSISSLLTAALLGVGFVAVDNHATVLLNFDTDPPAEFLFNAPRDFDDAKDPSGLAVTSDGASITVFDENGEQGGAATGDFTYWFNAHDFSAGATFELDLTTLEGNEVTAIGLSLQQDGDQDEGSFEFAADAGDATAAITLPAGKPLTNIVGIKLKFYEESFQTTPNLELHALRLTSGS